MGMFRLQKYLLWFLSLTGVMLFPNLLTTEQVLRHRWYYFGYVIVVQSVFISIGLTMLFIPFIMQFPVDLDKTSTFVLIVGYCHWHIILASMAMHSVLNMKKLKSFYDILQNIEDQSEPYLPRTLFGINLAMTVSIVLRFGALFWVDSFPVLSLINWTNDAIQFAVFDLYNFHVICLVWSIRKHCNHLNSRLGDVLKFGSYQQIIDALRATDSIYALLQAFNSYYGTFMLKMCMTVFVRSCLAFYFMFLASRDWAFVIAVSVTLFMYTWWHCAVVCGMFSICRSTTTVINETVLSLRFFQECNIVDSKITYQMNRFMLKTLHKQAAFRVSGCIDVNGKTIHLIFGSVITFLIILIQFKNLDD
ncbi:uncharacterized protein LOC129728383 [Wyeomyia smithii]|uniref:uncharacterized protein LOC129728383 n=1 Tax=Wyeomyia smithii TaxID=174621 RepID=UPI002467C8BB|nr:uncharacterized protein LOC129728383 [Wyeomyia smithii]